jgi:GTPase
MEKQNIKEREAKLRRELSEILEKLGNQKIRNTHRYTSMPCIALVGYTNAGKSAIINMTTGSHLESEDRLF